MPARPPHHRPLARAIAVLAFVALAPLVAGCGSKSPVAPKAATGGLESGNAVTVVVGRNGAEIVAHSSSGIEYRLDVPSGALVTPTSITITPVASLAGFPLSAGFAGGLEVRPAGLHFARAATLEITTTATAPAGAFLTGVSARSGGGGFAITPAFTDPGRIQLPVPNFAAASGAGGGFRSGRAAPQSVADSTVTVFAAGFGTEEDLRNLTLAGAPSNAAFISQLAAAVAHGADAAALAAICHDWFTQVVLPEIQDAHTDDALVQACADFSFWKEQQLQSHSSPLPADEAAGLAALAPQMRSAFDADNALMAAQQSFDAMANCLFWRDQAGFFGVATLANRLDPATLRADLKLRIDFGEPIALPLPLQVGFPNTFEVPIGVIFEGHGSEVTPAHFFCTAVAVGADLDHASGNTGVFPNSSAQEGFASGLIARTNGTITVSLTAALVPVVVVDAHGTVSFDVSDIDATHDYVLSGLDVSGRWEGVLHDTRTDNQNGQVTSFDLPFHITFTQNQNAVSGTWEVIGSDDNDLPVVTLGGQVTATLSGPTLLGWTLEQNIPAAGHYSGEASVSADGNTITTSFTGTSQGGSHVGTSTLSRVVAAAAKRRVGNSDAPSGIPTALRVPAPTRAPGIAR
jgi:hypothetical protein